MERETCPATFVKDSDPEKPKTDAPDPEENFSKDFAKATPEEKAAKWQALKKEQHAFIATWKKIRQKAAAQGDLGQEAGTARGSQDPPPPPPADQGSGLRPKAAPK